MKPLLKSLAISVLILFTAPVDALAQNKKGPPPWAPAQGYRAQTRHVYFPDHNFYFDLQNKVYIYFSGGKWINSVRKPAIFVSVNLGSALKVELDLNTRTPQKYNSAHKLKYKKTKIKKSPYNKPKGNYKPKSNPGKGNKKHK